VKNAGKNGFWLHFGRIFFHKIILSPWLSPKKGIILPILNCSVWAQSDEPFKTFKKLFLSEQLDSAVWPD
jgi:hypothetical protein